MDNSVVVILAEAPLKVPVTIVVGRLLPRVYADVDIHDGDLTTVRFVSNDRLSITFEGKELELAPIAFASPGEFEYKTDKASYE
ncbi:hypothetical protein FOZ60_013150 [Perkinsus olseni]|uniref:Uncharacterized protein n=1 Tax=Perkinsus olseni TaxID=32597 RepID=A0A7J6N9S3_PEROL|nr:hypothetical protein FOZ60_013150 [Perkinsus olseni]